MKIPSTMTLVLILLAVPGLVHGQSDKEKCLKAAQAKLAACQQRLPPNITPKDPKKPTESEKAAMLAYTEASRKCNTEGSSAALACK